METRAHAIAETSKKNCIFSIKHLSDFVNNRFIELSGEKFENNEAIRSHSAQRYDIHRWGAKWVKN